ncbi:YadA-like family protein [Burkholderia stagnalis]|uniref:YadA-like family protein n=1 Tax=Burkholderia stagnalis TaxID=1503054 RepID=UPI000751C9D2|nr:YadA-like family protein [Burkholderia stagnalis]KVO63030.1 hemagglutinin [Burkholderia stagnalis]KVP04531.1 hemagglutinin [Burkholderia stagnalis]KVW90174.1 hemagglutinin [Burkholderia stagnalis]KWH69683.1 hemagglutinin [Burkholderia stagnalis]
MEKKQISMLVTAMFAGVGIMGAGAAHATGCGDANFVDRGNPDNSGAYSSSQPGWAQNGGGANCTGIALGDGANANRNASGDGTGGSVAVGVNARALNNSAIAIAPSAMAAGNSAVAIGRQSAAVGDYATALGNVADAHGDRSIALGHSAYAVDSQTVAIGSAKGGGTDGVSGGATFDSKTQTRAAGKRAVAIGAGAVTSGDDQLAIGSNSIGANNGGTPVFGGTAAPVGGAVSFGSTGKERQLKNVAAGAADTDAVNVQQLKNVNSGLSTSIGNVDARVTNVNNTLSTSITNATNTLNQTIDAKTKNAVKFTDDSHAAIALDGKNGTTISGVAAGVQNTDAANVGQLNTGLSNVTNTVNNQISQLSTSITNQIGQATKDAVQYDSSAHDQVTFGGKGANSAVGLHNVAAGTADTDAVNVKQLSGGLSSVSTSISNNVSTQISTLSTSITNQIGSATKNAVQYDGDAHTRVTLGGTNASAPVALSNVADGVAKNDAVNVGQLSKATGGLQSQIDTTNNTVTTHTQNITALQQADTRNVKYDGAQGFDSVTLAGANGTKLTNVKAGALAADSTDAVNGSQLYATNQQVGTNAAAITNIDGRVTKVEGGVVRNTTDISNLQASDALSVKYDTTAKNSVTLGGANAVAPVTLSNVADGVAKNDAVNVGQLSKATGGLQSQIDTTNNIVTTHTQNITALQQADTRNVKYDGAQGFDSVTLAGANGTTLTNVKAGALAADSTDAVNGSQLFATNQNVKQQGDAITSIDGRVTQNTTHIGALQQDALQWSKSAGAYDASHNSGSAQKITNVAAGDVSATSTDAINGAQLKSVQDQISGNIGGATKNAVQYDTDAQGNRTNSVSLVGGASGPVTINNVAAGDLSANSTQAVNGAQLYATNRNVATQTSRVDNLTANVSSLTSNLSVTNANVSNLQAADKLNVKYDAAGKNSVTLGGAGHAPVALSNVADGVNANDAVNVGQLSKATGGLQSQIDVQGDKITNVDQRVTTNTTNIGQNTTDIAALKQDALQWNAGIGAYDASHGTASPQTIANVKAGQADTDAVNVKQLKDSVSSGVNNGATNAVLYDDSSKRQVSLGAGNGGVPVRVTNVAEGGVQAGSLDAVNGSQLRYATDSTAAALGGGASANTNGSINAPKYDIGGTSFNNVGDALGNLDGRVTSNATTIQNHETRLGNAETNIANNTTIISGLQRDALQFDPAAGAYNAARDGVATKITGVADGNVAAGSKDAVNGGQLFGVKSDLQQQITNVSNQAGEAVKNVVKYDVDANGSRLNSVSLVGGDAASPVVLKNLAAGVDDTDAVNVKQLKAVQSGINQLGAMAVTYDDSSKSIITLGGGAGGTKITNVQAGTLSAASTDAVNGSQLYATNQQVAKNTTDITNLQENVTNVTNGKAGLVQQQDPNGQITVGAGTGGTSVNIANSAGGNRVLTGVGAGVNSNDAVNVGQLNSALRDVSANQAIRAAATDANTTWITRAEAGSFGSTATATGKNAVAVGQGSVADRDNSFSVGAKGSERQVTNVAAGTAPTDAVNVQQLNDNVAAARSYTDQRVGQVYNDLNTVKKDMFGGVASALAVAGLPQPTGPGRSMVSAATANYRGQQGFAAGYSYVTQNDKWVVKASVTGNTRSDFGAVVGAGYQF